MDFEWLVIWISFAFCLAILTGGMLLLFRFGKLNQLPAKRFLHYYIILMYTFGFYSLWSQVFIDKIPESIQFSNIEFVRNTVFVMGTPFLIIGLILQVIWAYRSQSKSFILKITSIILPIVLLASAYYFYLLGTEFLMTDLVRLYSLAVISFSLSTLIVFLSGSSEILPMKWKWIIALFLALSGAIHLGNFTGISQNEFYMPLYILLFFLFNTIVEVVFLYKAEVSELIDTNSFDDFVRKFQITKRETDIIRGIYSGKSNQEIADEQFITLQTVKDHTSRIYQKTEVNRRPQLIAILRQYLDQNRSDH